MVYHIYRRKEGGLSGQKSAARLFIHKPVLQALSLVVLLLVLLNAERSAAYSQKSADLAGRYVDNGGFQVGRGAALSYRADTPFIPASTLKVLTALVALDILGADFRFTTRMYIEEKGKEKNLYIQGGGDPLLTSEVVLEICRRLKLMSPELAVINTLYLDDSLYKLDGHQISIENSDNPYDAPNGALAVNFNTIPILIGKKGELRSGEVQTPTLPIMSQKAKLLKLGCGRHRINVAYQEVSSEKKVIGLTPSLRYAGQLFAVQLEKFGITVTGGIQRKKTPQNLLPELIYKSENDLASTIKLLLAHSSNFVANQIFLQLSLQANRDSGKPASWQQSREIVRRYIKKRLKIPAGSITAVEGSGLSLQNRISCRAMITILEAFKSWAHLMKKEGAVLKKSGSMQDTGIFCYAGYFARGTEHNTIVMNLPSTKLSPQLARKFTPFVLLLNQHRNSRNALLAALYENFSGRSYSTAAGTASSGKAAAVSQGRRMGDKREKRGGIIHIKKRRRWKRIIR